MRKTSLLFLQLLLIFITGACLLAGAADRSQIEEGDSSQSPSDFDLWEQGHPIGILLDSGKETIGNYREQFHLQLSGQDETGTLVAGSQEYLIEVDRAAKEQYEFENVQSPSTYLSGVREYATVDGYSYLVRDAYQEGRVCEKIELPEDTSHYSTFTVIRPLQSITPGELLEKGVPLNGIQADVYEIKDVSMLLVREKNKVGGKVWIAQ